MTKICSKCLIEKDKSLFGKKKKAKDGLYNSCKECVSSDSKLQYEKNSEKKRIAATAYYNQNKETILANRDSELHKERARLWRKSNPEKRSSYKSTYRSENKDRIMLYNREYKRKNRKRIQEQWNNRLQTDPMFKVRVAISKRLWEVAKNKGVVKSKKFNQYIGCTPEVLFKHLESQFLADMNWTNHGKLWNIDHIIPITAAKSAEHLAQLSHYKNLQPLYKIDNLIKSDSINKCWQKLTKDISEESDRQAGHNFNLDPKDFDMNIEQLNIEHREFIQKYEWLGKIGYGVKWVFTARHEGNLAGVVMISEPNAYQFGEKEALIQRGAVSSWAPKNLNSMLVMFACRWMVRNTVKRYFVAYSDPDAGEIGTIYQACNFDYLGQKFGSDVYFKLPSGKLVTSRHFTRTSAMKRWAKALDIAWKPEWTKSNGYQESSLIPKEIKDYAKAQQDKCPKVKQNYKGKYVLLLNYGKEKIKKTWTPEAYPKRDI